MTFGSEQNAYIWAFHAKQREKGLKNQSLSLQLGIVILTKML